MGFQLRSELFATGVNL